MSGRTVRPGGESLHVDVGDGLSLHVTRAGRGSPLVLLHGFTGSTETWTPLRAALADRFETIAIDLPGHGRSGAPDDPARYALARFADDLARVLDVVNVRRVAVLGYSLGGRAALRFALHHADLVAALVLESTSFGISDLPERDARLSSDIALADAIERDGVPDFVDRWERLPLWASQATLPYETRTRLHSQRLDNRPDGLANSLRGAGAGLDQPIHERLAEMRMPILLIVGALDDKYVAIGRQMETMMPQARLVVVQDVGHAVHVERPAALAEFVATFLGDASQE